ncbi:amidase [Labedella phragmitis]|uniref:Amidase n=1 Tax=Labedella phragmitis TaxID=2498849 RepID=A0A444PPS6_9MICO|nr:amidase [Labedella phragmitis]RWZ46432.1 amidase [Labedella phragmitis]
MTETEWEALTALELWTHLQRDRISPVELTQFVLDRAELANRELGAFATLTPDIALARARHVQDHQPRTDILWGLPLADKDLTARAGTPIAWGSRAFPGTVSVRSDAIVDVLDRSGAISIGKTATPEFGLYGYTEPFGRPPARNPWDPSLGTGGSSGGAAAAVAARVLPFAPASDGGGSIRIPAAACGLVGLKPSRGRVPSGSALDSLAGLAVKGPIARTVTDAALLFDAMLDRRNGRLQQPFSVGAPAFEDGDYLGVASRGEGRFSLGLLANSPWDDDVEITLDPEARAAVDLALEQFAAIGHTVDDVTLDHGNVYPDAFRTIWQVSAAMLPVDGDTIGLLEPVTQELVARGRRISARTLAETLSTLATFERRVIEQFDRFDAVITPTLALTPRRIGWHDVADPDRNFAQQVQYSPFTSFVNVAGLPAITLPVYETPDGIPMGVQLIGRPGGEHVLLSIAAQLERRLHWQYRRPALS